MLCKTHIRLSLFWGRLHGDVKKITKKRQKPVDHTDEFCYDACGTDKPLLNIREKGKWFPQFGDIIRRWCTNIVM